MKSRKWFALQERPNTAIVKANVSGQLPFTSWLIMKGNPDLEIADNMKNYMDYLAKI